MCTLGGVASFQRPGSDLQYLGLVAGVALEQEPKALLLLVAPADESSGKKDQQQPCVFLLAGPPGTECMAVSVVQNPVTDLIYQRVWDVTCILLSSPYGCSQHAPTLLTVCRHQLGKWCCCVCLSGCVTLRLMPMSCKARHVVLQKLIECHVKWYVRVNVAVRGGVHQHLDNCSKRQHMQVADGFADAGPDTAVTQPLKQCIRWCTTLYIGHTREAAVNTCPLANRLANT